ncbi:MULTISPECIES: C4-dicarboxylate TRAP transporter substrate-binding protein [Oceanobacillus]|uniref:C4-dicarboxylate ABC transporter n=1 Tax=Oceanobacillus sojae TaxID=582851 RepID=A0A511ZEC0_9BACI|nr:C4-dicarboxylate TRAP transporter substrate-binding protein [Oceanobacillus sojae]GEN85793.1 C4-dicarboxylate ABC transporter [Oceanobacillus sojae]
MTKNLLMISMLSMILLLIACGSDNDADAGDYTLRLGITQNDQNAEFKGVETFKEGVEKRTEGEVTVELYHSDQLANVPDLVEQASMGNSVGTISDAAMLGDLKKEFYILQSPYMFDSYDQIGKVTESELYQGWVEDFADQGIRILSFNYYLGERNLATTSEVTSAADLRSNVIRTSGAQIVDETISSMGASPSGMPWTEAYPGLEQGVINGVEAHNLAIYESSMYEVINHIAKTNHYQLVSALIVSEDWYDNLPEEYQEIVIEEAEKSGEAAAELALEQSREYEELMGEYGVEFHEVDREEFRELTEQVYEKLDMTEIREEVLEVLNQ